MFWKLIEREGALKLSLSFRVGLIAHTALILATLNVVAEETPPPKSPVTSTPSPEKQPAEKKTDEKKPEQKDEKKAQTINGAGSALGSLSIEQLMDIRVTSVSKTPERAKQAAAAVHVITNEDIRRSGVRTIADALRMSPGMQVARMTSSQWAISARGFPDVFANKMLVLMDGRTVYDPTFSGTFWDVQDTVLEDIDRIEVIRGPGATMWGSNAVNGVVNIITKSAKDTVGGLAVAGVGTEEKGFGTFRYGKQFGNVYARVYAKYFDRDEQVLPGGREAHDDWRQARGGFRVDWDASKCDHVTFSGDIYRGHDGERITVPILSAPFSKKLTGDDTVGGENVLGRWTHTISDTSEFKVQSYYDRTQRDVVGTASVNRDTFDLEFQHQFKLNDRNNIVWGLDYRLSSDDTRPHETASWDPEDRTLDWAGAFFQDEMVILKDKLNLTLGARLEHNDFTGLEAQPTGRVLWTPHKNHTVWASVSRAVRIPNRTTDDVRFNLSALPPGTIGPNTPAALTQAVGDKDTLSEELISNELGYRLQPHKRVSFDFAGFVNIYHRLESAEPEEPTLETTPAPAHLVLPFRLDNKTRGEAYGGEVVANFQAMKWWRIQATYSYFQLFLHSESANPNQEAAEGNSPRNQAMFRSLMDLPHDIQLDFDVRYVDSLSGRNVPAYVVGDIRVGWRPTKNLDVSLVGQNLFHNQHLEFRPLSVQAEPTEVQHSVYLKATLKF